MPYKESCRTCETHLRSILIYTVCMEMSLDLCEMWKKSKTLL